jgi:Na+-transporting methylmalonyl-CoA/oxaloacetate decarboxylase gamma subunit
MTALFGWIIAAPAIPNDVGGKYVAGAYVVFIVLLLIYVAIMGMKLARIERGLSEVAEIAEQRKESAGAAETVRAEVKS